MWVRCEDVTDPQGLCCTSSGWRKSLLHEAVPYSPQEFHCHQTPGRARCQQQPASAPSDVLPPRWWLHNPSGHQPQPVRYGSIHPRPPTSLTLELWHRRAKGSPMMRMQVTKTDLRWTVQRQTAGRMLEWLFSHPDMSTDDDIAVHSWISITLHRLEKLTCVSSLAAAASSWPPLLPAQSRNFSLNRDVSLCSETQPNSAQLGRPSPLLMRMVGIWLKKTKCEYNVKIHFNVLSTLQAAVLDYFLFHHYNVLLQKAHRKFCVGELDGPAQSQDGFQHLSVELDSLVSCRGRSRVSESRKPSEKHLTVPDVSCITLLWGLQRHAGILRWRPAADIWGRTACTAAINMYRDTSTTLLALRAESLFFSFSLPVNLQLYAGVTLCGIKWVDSTVAVVVCSNPHLVSQLESNVPLAVGDILSKPQVHLTAEIKHQGLQT